MKKILILSILLLPVLAQAQKLTRQDTLRGSITTERAWWDLMHYHLEVEVFPEEKAIRGKNTITYKVLAAGDRLQIDLQRPMGIYEVTQDGQLLQFESEGSAHFVQVPPAEIGSEQQIEISFSGTPREARRPPWDGGYTWSKDGNEKPFIATSNQGIGASIWWPNKDHPYDEPDRGIHMAITTPADLVAVGNGRLKKIYDMGDRKTYNWEVINPINNYGVNVNVGDYVNFSEIYSGLDGELLLDYWVLSENLEKAKEQFKQAPMMIEAFEHWFGPYPFYEDSFKLVEVPYLGMEHQSSVTYGNKYQNGYLGNDLSRSGWGLKFDFIIIHEGGHEWFANNITNSDVADMWVHEGFTAYSENLYLDYHFGKEASSKYVTGTRGLIQNERPVIGTYGVNKRGSGDMYYKGANTLHTLRQLIEDDEKWRSILVGLNKDYYHQVVSSKMVEEYISEKSGIDLTQFWDQYLRTNMVPTIQYKWNNDRLEYRYTKIVDGFDMPVIAVLDGKEEWIFPKAQWQTLDKTVKDFQVKIDFYVETKKVD